MTEAERLCREYAVQRDETVAALMRNDDTACASLRESQRIEDALAAEGRRLLAVDPPSRRVVEDEASVGVLW